MYQGEVNVAEYKDLHSFLEAAEDLDMRGLSEANTESLISNRETPISSRYYKRKRAAERQQKSRFNLDNPSDGLEINNFINNVNKTSYNQAR